VQSQEGGLLLLLLLLLRGALKLLLFALAPLLPPVGGLAGRIREERKGCKGRI
jgi:hypothetical protein